VKIMALMLFWLKITLKRITNLFKSSPVMFIWLFIIIGAFIFAIINRHLIITPDISTLFYIVPFLVLFSIFASFKNYNLMPELILYSKSKNNNKKIIVEYFIKKVVFSNILLIICCIIALFSKPNVYLFLTFTGLTVFMLILSFFIMYIKNNYISKRVIKKEKKGQKINPYIKSIVYDYATPDFYTVFALSISLFSVITVETVKDSGFFSETANQYIYFVFILILFSIGFSGIIESVQNINWKYQSILSENTIKYHYKRTLIFLLGTYGILILIFIIIGNFINPVLFVKYIVCVFFNIFATINLAFIFINKLIKIFILAFIIVLTAFISILPAFLLAVLLIPAVITFIKAKNDYKEWYLL